MILPTNCFQSWNLILFRQESRRYVEHLFECEICRVHNGLTIVQVILSHEYCWFHCYSHKTFPKAYNVFSPFSVTFDFFVFFAPDHSPDSQMILILLTIPMLLHRFQWRTVETCLFLRIDVRSPWSVARCFLVHNGLRGSVVRETKSNFSCQSPRSFIKSLRSLVCLNISFPLLRRPSAVVTPLWSACWREAFHKLFMVIEIRSFLLVYADIRSPWSLLYLSNWTPKILTSITSLLQAYWSRGRYVRRRPCNKIHYWSRFCCDSFFSWIVLRSFLHCIRAHCRTENGWYWTSTTDDSIRHVWNFPWLACLRVGSWCQRIWLGFFWVQIDSIE